MDGVNIKVTLFIHREEWENGATGLQLNIQQREVNCVPSSRPDSSFDQPGLDYDSEQEDGDLLLDPDIDFEGLAFLNMQNSLMQPTQSLSNF